MINTQFIKIPAWMVDMQSDINAPAYMPIVLQELIDIYDAATRLKVEIDESGYMTLTTKFICKNLKNSMADHLVSNCIRYLNSDDIKLIDYKTDFRNLYIKIDFDKVNEMKQKYYKDDYKLKFYIVYYFVINFTTTESPKSPFLHILMSILLHEASEGKFSKEMSVEYIHAKFNKQFTYNQEKIAKKKLVKKGILSEEVKKYRSDDGNFYRRCFFTINQDKVDELINDYNEKNKCEHDTCIVEKYQKCDFKTHTSAYATLDGLKTDSYTKEEIEMFRRQADELEASGEKAWF